ncbi:discoidin domain-containing protein [Spirochaeta lutea]|uniref:discoidin domain-containing protein n=1 Tax=Spirochaeta lutea TaxID=1480694 RepID=UPI00068AD34D|nr:discoidin domain-containing protein [Spirochaeta lutea]
MAVHASVDLRLAGMALIVLLGWIMGCTTSKVPSSEELFTDAGNRLDIQEPEGRETSDPLIMVHYMPWFEAPPISSGFGFHWHMGGGVFDPYRILENGRVDIGSHYYPLTGPYDSSDPQLLRYQVSLMKLAGIDGVIFDWYGIEDALDYRSIHESTLAMIKVLGEAGLKFAICYEDQSIGHMIEAGVIPKDGGLAAGERVMQYMQDTWFTDPGYLTHEGRPVLLTFGPQYFVNPEHWDRMFSRAQPRPLFMTLDGHSASIADGSFAWPPMWASEGGVLAIPRLVTYLNEYYRLQRDSPFLVTTAFPGFHDIYREASTGPSYGFLDDYDGRTFQLTLEAALKSQAQVIQIATWNDYGEGTMVEPTAERGYRDLEYLQTLQIRQNPRFLFGTKDLRIPLELYRISTDAQASEKARVAAENATTALLAGDLAAFRTSVSEAGVKIPPTVLPLLPDAWAGADVGALESPQEAAYNPGDKPNLALGRPVSANSHIYDFIPQNAVDGQTTTYWEGGADRYPNRITVDLGRETQLEAVVIRLNPARIWATRIQRLAVLGSSDGEDFSILVPEQAAEFDPQTNGNTYSLHLTGAARYLQVLITANDGANAGQIAELEIYGR